MSKLAQDLKYCRDIFGLTQEELADILRVSAGQVSRIERRAHEPPPATRARYEAILDALYTGAQIEKDRGVRLAG